MAKQLKICLDPGHYGSKYNAGAVSGYYESNMTWALTMYEKEELEKMGVSVVLTRTSKDADPALVTRGKTSAGCDLFVSNHSNACGTPSVSRVVGIYMVNRTDTAIDDTSKAFANKLAAVVANTMGLTYQTYSKNTTSDDRDGNGKLDDNYYGVLHGAFMAKTPGIILEHGFHTNAGVCRWLMEDANLRKLAKACANCMVEFLGGSTEVVESTDPAPAPAPSTSDPTSNIVVVNEVSKNLWAYLRKQGISEIGAAAFMGNVHAESTFKPTNLQNSYESKLKMNDAQYTAAVDNGTYKNFVNDKAGYGLAQWTSAGRKQNMYNFMKGRKLSIGDANGQIEFMFNELKTGYPGVYNGIKNATDLLTASNLVLQKYEIPAGKDDPAVQKKRATYGEEYYRIYKGTATPTTGELYRVRKSWSDSKSQLGAYSDIKNAKAMVDKNPGYKVYDSKGNQVYPEVAAAPAPSTSTPAPSTSPVPYKVKVEIKNLQMRISPNTTSSVVGTIKPGIYTIVQEVAGSRVEGGKTISCKWGKLKSPQSYKGRAVDAYICLDYAKKV